MRFARTGAVAAVILAAAIAAAIAYGAPHPSVSKLHASPSSLPSGGGHVSLKAHLKHAKHCTLSASPHIAKLPHTVKCAKATVVFHVTVPADTTTSAKHYVLKLKVTAAGGSASAHVTVVVAADQALVEAAERKAKEEREAKEAAEHKATEEREATEKEEREAKEKEEKEGAAIQVSVGEAEACAVLADGKVYCWGEDSFGQLGNGKVEEDVLRPTEVTGVEHATQVSVGQHDACAVLSDGHVDCWGENARGQVGDEMKENGDISTPVEVKNLEKALEVQVGWTFACARIEGGTVKCWGENQKGNVGDGEVTVAVLKPTEAKVSEVVKLDSYFKHSCAILTSGALKCWGYDFYDELGNVEEKNLAVDTPAEAIYTKHVTSVSLGHYTSCAVEGGKVPCWGNEEHGMLGDGKQGTYEHIEYEPIDATGITTAEEVALGYEDACVRLTSGHVDCWGVNNEGAVGNGEGGFGKYPVDEPTEVVNLSEAVQISAGDETECAVVKTGHVYCWGLDERGQVGNEKSGDEGGSPRGVYEPTEVKNLP
ncbi:MAG TPA: hypothetical protein VMA83_09555 [Solirubrobacteraceae bacterium]|nr:hypothetical protein [Solirubrobacteraceae bacterium]